MSMIGVIPILATIHKFEDGTFWYTLARYDEEQMKIEEAILYCLASQNRGMRTEQIAEMINRNHLHIRKDGQPVTSNQVYAAFPMCLSRLVQTSETQSLL